MDKIKELKAELFDIQVRIEQLVNLKNQKLQELQATINEEKVTKAEEVKA